MVYNNSVMDRAGRPDKWERTYKGSRKHPRLNDYEHAGGAKDYTEQMDLAVPSTFRKIMNQGRVALEPYFRYHGLKAGDFVAVTLWDDGVLLSRADMYCELCRKPLEQKDDHVVFKGRLLCGECLGEVKENGTLKGATRTGHGDNQV
jgi:hypothetical protein